jgi:hypothetical protein
MPLLILCSQIAGSVMGGALCFDYQSYDESCARRATIAPSSYYNKALVGYDKHSGFTYALSMDLRKTNYNKNLKIEIGGLADYAADQVLAITWMRVLEPTPMRDFEGMLFPIRMKP